MTGLRLLHLPDEQAPGDQVGPRRSFASMAAAGGLSDYRAFSFLVEARRSGVAAMLDALVADVRANRPDLLFWQHVGGLRLEPCTLQRLRQAAPDMKILYHEGDMYGRGKPVPPATALLMAQADAVALVSRGTMADWARRHGACRVLYCPSAVDTLRFGQPWHGSAAPDFDVVMIANRVQSRLPWRRMPGAARRIALAQALDRRHGIRFGLFGAGWRGCRGWQGPLDYAGQEAALRRGRVSVGWNHFDEEAGYFSDRLPIALLSGVPHVANAQPGCEPLFGSAPPFERAASVPAAVAAVDRLLATDAAVLAAMGRQAQQLARRHLLADVVFPRLLADALASWR